jgi:hypothetical protein
MKNPLSFMPFVKIPISVLAGDSSTISLLERNILASSSFFISFFHFLNEKLLLQLVDCGIYPPFANFILLQEQLHL